MHAQALCFPPRRQPSRWEAPIQGAPAVALRDADSADLPFLRRLYASSRAAELAAIPWPESARQAFCDSQFDLQHQHYVTHFVSADFLIVLQGHVQIGRLYLHEADRILTIVDILLDDAVRGQGLGSALLRRLQQEVRERAFDALTLQVLITNHAARRLYERHGFVVESDDAAMRLGMRWRPDAPSS
jgi:ribosomal protein S18 acetylase RimI-like enzyme